VVTLGLTLLYIGSTTLRRPGTSSFFFDVVIANLGYAGCTALCAWRAVARRRGRWGWGSLAAGLFLFTTGSVLWTTWVQYFNPVPYPSISDACFLTFYFLAFIGIALLVRETVPRTSRTIWVDGLIAGLGVAALETTLVISPIATLNIGDTLTVATNIAYPIGDLVLVTMVVAVFAVRGWRPGRLWWMLGIGLVVFAAADSVYVLRVLSNTYVTGTPLDSLWLIGALFMAFAAWQRMGVGSAAGNLPTVEAPNIIPVVHAPTCRGSTCTFSRIRRDTPGFDRPSPAARRSRHCRCRCHRRHPRDVSLPTTTRRRCARSACSPRAQTRAATSHGRERR
jgi:hypothetical protein